MLLQHVVPLFDSPHGHLRAKACWLAGHYADVRGDGWAEEALQLASAKRGRRQLSQQQQGVGVNKGCTVCSRPSPPQLCSSLPSEVVALDACLSSADRVWRWAGQGAYLLGAAAAGGGSNRG